jgi:hypothetical protein
MQFYLHWLLFCYSNGQFGLSWFQHDELSHHVDGNFGPTTGQFMTRKILYYWVACSISNRPTNKGGRSVTRQLHRVRVYLVFLLFWLWVASLLCLHSDAFFMLYSLCVLLFHSQLYPPVWNSNPHRVWQIFPLFLISLALTHSQFICPPFLWYLNNWWRRELRCIS